MSERLKPYLIREDGAGFGTQVVVATSFAEALAIWKKWAAQDDCVDDRDPDSVEEINCDQLLVSTTARNVLSSCDTPATGDRWLSYVIESK